LLFIVSRTKPGTYHYMKLVSESEHAVILDRPEGDHRRYDGPLQIWLGASVPVGVPKDRSPTGHAETAPRRLHVTVAFAASPNLSRRFPMPRRPPPHIDAELSGRIAAFEIARAQLFDVDADRKKRIDGVIDYFGTPHIAVARDRVRQPPGYRLGRLAGMDA
jgi:hypothetical protein